MTLAVATPAATLAYLEALRHPVSPVGFRPDGHCRHCGARPTHHTATRLGAYCLACCHWITKETT